jgi:hypothetical protein
MISIVDHRGATSASAEPNCIRLLNLSVSLLRQRKPSIVNCVVTLSRRQRANNRTTVTHISITTNNTKPTTICFLTKNVSIVAPHSVTAQAMCRQATI